MANEKQKSRLNVMSEEDAIDMIEKSCYGRKASIKDVKIAFDSTEDVNSHYDCSRGQRKITFGIEDEDGIILGNIIPAKFYIELAIVTDVWVSEAEDDNGNVIGSDNGSNCWLEGEQTILESIKERANAFDNAKPQMQYEFSNGLSEAMSKNVEINVIANKVGDEVNCDNCNKKFIFDENRHPHEVQIDSDCKHGSLLVCCSDECWDKVYEPSEDEYLGDSPMEFSTIEDE